MWVTYREIMSLSSMQDLKIIAGKKGLKRPIRWVYLAEVIEDIRESINWLQGGELIFITGIGIKNNIEFFIEFIEKIHSKNVAGLVINIGPYIRSTPKEVIELADSLSFPILELPWSVPFVEATKELCSYIIRKETEQTSINGILKSILAGDNITEEAFIEQASFYDYNISFPMQAVIVYINQSDLLLEELKTIEKSRLKDIIMEAQQITKDIFRKYYGNILTYPMNDSFTILLPSKQIVSVNKEIILEKVKKEISKKIDGLKVSIGIGNKYGRVKDLQKSINEALRAIKIIKHTKFFNRILYYKDLGVYNLLLEIKDSDILIEFYEKTLGNLKDNGGSDQGDLLETLKIYLEENGNASKTAKRLFIHRNTLRYRIDKIQNICDCNLQNYRDCFNLQMAIYIRSFIEAGKKDISLTSD